MNAERLKWKPRGAALLQPDRTRAIWRAAILELARVGYDKLSMEAVARRAGVGKAALYRRWAGKEAMVIALIAAVEIEIIGGTDRGSLHHDIRFYLEEGFRLLRRPLAARILPEFYAEVSRDSELGAAIRSTVLKRKQDSISGIIQRAVERGELSSSIDHQLAFDLIVGPIYWHAIINSKAADEAYLDAASLAITVALKSICPNR